MMGGGAKLQARDCRHDTPRGRAVNKGASLADFQMERNAQETLGLCSFAGWMSSHGAFTEYFEVVC
jgi:hypothetical protein